MLLSTSIPLGDSGSDHKPELTFIALNKLLINQCCISIQLYLYSIAKRLTRYHTFAHASILHTFRVNRYLQDTYPVYVASGTSETNA